MKGLVRHEDYASYVDEDTGVWLFTFKEKQMRHVCGNIGLAFAGRDDEKDIFSCTECDTIAPHEFHTWCWTQGMKNFNEPKLNIIEPDYLSSTNQFYILSPDSKFVSSGSGAFFKEDK